jgi:CBS domain containing-hemolysin-like protein
MDADDSGSTAGDLMRPASFLSTLMALPDALRQMTAEKAQLACVVDEFGGFAGVLTLEDLAEELVGEITDEHDPSRPDRVIALGNGVWLVPGDFHLDEIERSLGHALPEGDYETIAGLVISACGSLPEVGAAVEVGLPSDHRDLAFEDEPPVRSVRAEVVAVENHVPSSIRLRLRDRDLVRGGER